MHFPQPSKAFSELAAYLDTAGWSRRAQASPIWTSDQSGCLLSFVIGRSAEAQPRILEVLLECANPVFLGSRNSPADDPDLGGLEWVPSGPNAWRVPAGLSTATFLDSGFAADDSYRLSVHAAAPPDFAFGDDICDGPVGPYLEGLRSRGVWAVFVSGPHFGWALALPFLELHESAV